MSDIDFGKIFNELCENSGKNNSEIARGLEVDKATISRWRSGERSPKLSTLAMIADYFNINIQILTRSKQHPEENLNSDFEFTSAEDAMRFIIEQPMIAAYGGYDLDHMNDDEVIQFANTVLDLLKVAAKQLK